MEPKPANTANQKPGYFPGYLFLQFTLKQRASGEDLALLSILDKSCLEGSTSAISNGDTAYDEYIPRLRMYKPDHFFEILREVNNIQIDILDIDFSLLSYTVIPFKGREMGIFGTLSENDYGPGIQWSLVEIE